MSLSRRSCSPKIAARRHAANQADFWICLGYFFLEHLIPHLNSPDSLAELAAALPRSPGKNRRKRLSAAMSFGDETVRKLIAHFHTLTPTHVRRGTASTIDETLLAYYGADAKEAQIWRYIPEKPHAKGLIQYRAVSTFKLSLRRVIHAIVLIVPWARDTPTLAALKCIEHLQNSSHDALHVFLDTGFATAEMFFGVGLSRAGVHCLH